MKYLKEGSNKPSPLASVIIPTYNRPESLKEAIESVLRQEYTYFEIIVINDGGVDVQGVINGLNAGNKIKYISHEKNKGLAAARNTGIRIANGKYIAYLDDDDIFYPSHVEILVSFLESNEFKVAFTEACRAYQTKENDKYIITKRDIPYTGDFDEDKILINNIIPVLCVMHEKSCLEEVGFFDENLTAHEDWDLWIRMSRKFKFAHIKELTCEYRWRDDRTTMTGEKRKEFLKTMGIVYEKYNPYTKDRPHIHLEQKKHMLSLWEAIYLYRPSLEEKENLDKNKNVPEKVRQEYNELQSTLIKRPKIDSIPMIKKFLGHYPHYTTAHKDLGIIYFEKENKWEALTDIIQTLSINPHDLEAKKTYIHICSKLELFDQALKACYDILVTHPDDLGTLMVQGNLLFQIGRKKEALRTFIKVIAKELRIV